MAKPEVVWEKQKPGSVGLIRYESLVGLWPRFEGVKKAIQKLFLSDGSLNRELFDQEKEGKITDWGNIDKIRDFTYRGPIGGLSRLDVEGSVVDDHEYVVVDPELALEDVRRTNVEGYFISRDKKEGYAMMALRNGAIRWAAFWLEASWRDLENPTVNTHGLRLTQIVNFEGTVFGVRATSPSNRLQIDIPKTNLSVPYYRSLYHR